MLKLIFRKLSTLLPILLLTGCATIMHGTHQTMGISSNPSDADVWVDKAYVGRSPIIVDMKRNQNHIITIAMDGFQPYELTCTRQVSGWVFGNVVFGGIIGLAVDALTGGIYQLTPDQVQAELRGGCQTYCKQTAESYVTIVLEADPAWKKIGNMVAVN